MQPPPPRTRRAVLCVALFGSSRRVRFSLPLPVSPSRRATTKPVPRLSPPFTARRDNFAGITVACPPFLAPLAAFRAGRRYARPIDDAATMTATSVSHNPTPTSPNLTRSYAREWHGDLATPTVILTLQIGGILRVISGFVKSYLCY